MRRKLNDTSDYLLSLDYACCTAKYSQIFAEGFISNKGYQLHSSKRQVPSVLTAPHMNNTIKINFT